METEICPSCNNDVDNFLIGTGPNMVLYYHCARCHHDFAIDGSKYIEPALEQDLYENN